MCHKIAIFDYRITAVNPIGSRHLKVMEALCRQFEFTVFAVEFENPDPERIRWVRIPAPLRPYALLFAAYHLLAPLYYWFYVLRTKTKFDLLQFVESNLSFGDVAYAHFCHRAYLKHHWKESKPEGIQGMIRWLGHWLPSIMEPLAFRKAQKLIVPSHGLARELRDEYPSVASRIQVLSNAIDVAQMESPTDFDRDSFRTSVGFAPADVVLIFVAQGHYERKGLPQLLDALTQMKSAQLKLLVVGGQPGTVSKYRALIDTMGLGSSVLFTGWVPDMRPYMWIADAFVLPSFYETFSLVAFEAAAAGLPLIVTPLSGVEEFILDGENGFLVERRSEALEAALRRLLDLTPEERRTMGSRARQSVTRFAPATFITSWERFYAGA